MEWRTGKGRSLAGRRESSARQPFALACSQKPSSGLTSLSAPQRWEPQPLHGRLTWALCSSRSSCPFSIRAGAAEPGSASCRALWPSVALAAMPALSLAATADKPGGGGWTGSFRELCSARRCPMRSRSLCLASASELKGKRLLETGALKNSQNSPLALPPAQPIAGESPPLKTSWVLPGKLWTLRAPSSLGLPPSPPPVTDGWPSPQIPCQPLNTCLGPPLGPRSSRRLCCRLAKSRELSPVQGWGPWMPLPGKAREGDVTGS